jgi:hypothetical protein
MMRLTFRRWTSTNLNIRLFNDHASSHGLASSATILCSQQPLSVSFGEQIDWDYADTNVVISTLSWAKANSPANLKSG